VKKAAWRMCLLALPASLFAGTVTLTDGIETVNTTGNQISLGTCTTSCLMSGTASISSFLIHWAFTTPSQISATGTTPNFTLSGGTGTFIVDDTPSAGSDSVSGTVSLTSAVESGGSNQNMTINGTLTATSLSAGSGATSLLFLGILAQAGITPPVPPNKTENLAINITGCTNGVSTVSCLNTTGLTSIQAVGTTGTISSLGITSAVPEPTTMVLMAAGLAGLFIRRRRGARG
jgi:hypothetical protein